MDWINVLPGLVKNCLSIKPFFLSGYMTESIERTRENQYRPIETLRLKNEIELDGIVYRILKRDDKRVLYKSYKSAIYEFQKTSDAPNAYKRAVLVRYEDAEEDHYIVFCVKTVFRKGVFKEVELMHVDFGKTAWNFYKEDMALRYYDFLESHSEKDLIKASKNHYKYLESLI